LLILFFTVFVSDLIEFLTPLLIYFLNPPVYFNQSVILFFSATSVGNCLLKMLNLFKEKINVLVKLFNRLFIRIFVVLIDLNCLNESLQRVKLGQEDYPNSGRSK
jgi:hypothetical protein